MFVNEKSECIRSDQLSTSLASLFQSFKAKLPFLNLRCDCRVSLRGLVLSSFPSLASQATMKAVLYHQSPTTEKN